MSNCRKLQSGPEKSQRARGMTKNSKSSRGKPRTRKESTKKLPQASTKAVSLEAKLRDELAALTDRERAELDRLIDARRARTAPAKVRLVAKPGARPAIETGEAPGSDLLTSLKLEKAFAGSSMVSVRVRMGELLGYLQAAGVVDEDQINAAIAFVESMAPQDQSEALLLTQMYVTHRAAIRALGLMEATEKVPSLQTFGNLAVKLLRTSQGQMETLARMRRGGEQVVRHIHVDNRGGQAVITENLHTGGTENGKVADQSHAAGAIGFSPSLPGPDTIGQGMPGAGREGEAALQDARRHQPRRPKGK